MSKCKDILIADIAKRTGVDPTTVINCLYQMGTLDDVLARQHAAKVRVMQLYVTTDFSEREIHARVADELGLSRTRVGQLGRSIAPRT